ncbi:HAD family hydrolase [Microlunatus speluncae]|uniref:HAD family hydrolase n=1 Tax=Microlunatus speluncae TaxID=2594267 RepID=UPI001FEC4115|nr:HAD family hydrolase [Microlunatus speluncae]
MLMDLDNTLVDRDAAFGGWAGRFIDELSGDMGDLEWLIGADAEGYAPREWLAGAIKERFGLPDGLERLVERLLFEHVEQIEAVVGVPELLGDLAARGVGRVIVTNGTERQQRRKLAVTGLGELVDAVVISESVGCKKPDPRIFRLALGGVDPGDAWMIGDDPDADVRGGTGVGMRTGWVDRGRSWVGDLPPTVSGRTAPESIAAALAQVNES